MGMFFICRFNDNNNIVKNNIGGLNMSDEFLKTIKVVQSTGQAPTSSNQVTNDSATSAKLITESQQPTAKTYRFVMDKQMEHEKTDND